MKSSRYDACGWSEWTGRRFKRRKTARACRCAHVLFFDGLVTRATASRPSASEASRSRRTPLPAVRPRDRASEAGDRSAILVTVGSGRSLDSPAASLAMTIARVIATPVEQGRLTSRKENRWKSASRVQIAEDAVLAHQDGGVRVVDEVASEPWKRVDDFLRHVGVAFGRDEHPQAPARRAARGHERPGALGAPRRSHHSPGGSSPAGIRTGSARSCTRRPAGGAAVSSPWRDLSVPLGIRVQRRRRGCWCRRRPPLSAFHGLVEGVPVRDIDQRAAAVERRQGRERRGLLPGLERPRSAVSTSSDIVRPCRAASRLSSAMTVSSILSVVFIWKTISTRQQYVQPSPGAWGRRHGDRKMGRGALLATTRPRPARAERRPGGRDPAGDAARRGTPLDEGRAEEEFSPSCMSEIPR